MTKDIGYYKAKLKQREKEIAILRAISETIAYRWDRTLKDVLDSIIRVVNAYVQADSCFIYLLREDILVLEASQNPHARVLGHIQLKKGEGITGWVAEHQQAVALGARAYQDDRFKVFTALPEDRYEAICSIPILDQKRVVGVINIQHRRRHGYSKETIAFLEIIARQVAGAIEMARLSSETNTLKDALELRKVIERAKGILMREYSLTEPQAHQLLLKKSMDLRKSLKEVAEAIVTASEIAQ
ncbi:ANTAR domain-containing protein [Candidatus Uhrbacteria bacterium]|nr:ANTAR domain-containing protein [Candidatus Uhrbacteria bacterium]